MITRDPRLYGTGGPKLIQILVDAFPESGDAIRKGRYAGLPSGRIRSDTPRNEWQDVVSWADAEGKLNLLIEALLEELRGLKSFDKLDDWRRSRGFEGIAEVTPRILGSLETIGSSPDLALVEDEILLLSKDIAELVRVLSDPRAPEIGFAGIIDSKRTAQRARTAARHASAAVDALLYEVQSASTVLDENRSASDRDRTDRLINRGVLMRHLLAQRVDADAAVSELLDALLAAFPTALDVHAENFES